MNVTTITRSKPFYVVAGVGDLAVKTIREVPAQLASGRLGPVTVDRAVSTLRAEAVALPARATTTVVGVAVEVADRTDAVYGDLLTRGRRVVGRIRRQKATQDLSRDAGTTVRRTKAATTTAKKGAADSRSSAKRTATTTRKRATSTRTATKSAAKSARQTTTSAAKAVSDGAAKVGN